MVVLVSPPARKPLVVFRANTPSPNTHGLFVTADLFAPQFLHQPVLMRAVLPLTRPLACGELAALTSIPSFPHIRPNCVTGSSLATAPSLWPDVVPNSSNPRTPTAALRSVDPGAQRIATAQIVSCSPVAPTSCWWRRRPIDSSSPRTPLLQPSVKNCRPAAHLSKCSLRSRGEDAPPFPLATPQPPSASSAAAFGMNLQSISDFKCSRQRLPKRSPTAPRTFPHPS